MRGKDYSVRLKWLMLYQVNLMNIIIMMITFSIIIEMFGLNVIIMYYRECFNVRKLYLKI